MAHRLGLVTTMSPDSTWPDAVVAKVNQDHRQAEAALKDLGFQVITASDSVSRTKEEMQRHGKILRSAGVQVVVLYVGTWTYSNLAVDLATAVDVPVAVWTNSGPGNVGIVGGAVARGALDEVGITTTLVHGDFDDERTLEKLRTWCVGCAAATGLRGTTLGVGGSRCMGMYTAHVDPSEIRRKFGVDIDGWEQVEVIDRAGQIPDEDAYAFLEWMRTEFGAIQAREDAMIAQIKLYLALRDYIKEKGYDFVAVKCLPELPSCHTTFCVAHALLNDASDAFGAKEAIVCACEADINGALTMQILKNVSGRTALFADFLAYDEEDNLVTLCNCGSQPTDFAPSRKDVIWVSEGLQEFTWKIGGACPQYVAKPGKMTMARLGRINGEYIMLVMSGEAIAFPRAKLAEVNAQQPQAFVRLSCSPDDFTGNLRCNHIHAVYGDYIAELEVLCSVLGIRPIVL